MSIKNASIFIAIIICSLLSVPVLFLDVQAQNVPDWIKNTAKWFGEGQVTESEFLNAIKYLIENKEKPTTIRQISQELNTDYKNTFQT